MGFEDYGIKSFKNKLWARDIYLDDNKDRFMIIIRLRVVVMDGGKENIAIRMGT